MLYIIGLGLADEKDISVKGLEIVRRVDRVYLEAYTAVLLVDQDTLVSKVPSATQYHLLSSDECRTVGSLLWPVNHPRRSRDGRISK